jgi:hypothetical protein
MTTPDMPPSSWLVILAHVAGLRWVRAKRRMAFSVAQSRRALRMGVGDELFLCTARGAFNNPTRDVSQLQGLAHLISAVRPFRKPLDIGGRLFATGCHLEFAVFLPERAGIPFRPLVEGLEFIERKDFWSAYVRPGLIRLSPKDARFLRRALAHGGSPA